MPAAPKRDLEPAATKQPKTRPAFPTKKQAPTPETYAAGLPAADAKRFESTRAFLLKQKNVTETVHFYGPQAGWGLRYLVARRPLCALLIHGERALAVVSLGTERDALVKWAELDEETQHARQRAHEGADVCWFELLLTAKGAADLKTVLRSCLGA